MRKDDLNNAERAAIATILSLASQCDQPWAISVAEQTIDTYLLDLAVTERLDRLHSLDLALDARRRTMTGRQADFIDMVFGYVDRRLRSLRATAVISAMLWLFLLSVACTPALAQEGPLQPAPSDWTAVTLSRSAWGTARAPTVTQAIALAVNQCKSRAAGPSDCGAELKTIRTGWIVALRCGEYRVLVSGSTLEEADEAAAHRLLQLKYISNVSLPRCVRVLELGPAEEVIATNRNKQKLGSAMPD